jgi:AcrR family transcriptional regulator
MVWPKPFGSRGVTRPRAVGSLGEVKPATTPVPAGFRPPQQARTRATLEKLLEAAEQILAEEGFDEFTMAAVADRSKTSVGAIYRRFDGKEQLVRAVKDRILGRIEQEVADALAASADQDLTGVIAAFADALASAFAPHCQVIPDLLAVDDQAQRGVHAIATLHRMFLDALAPHLGDIRRTDPMTAVALASRTLIGACVHRASVIRALPDGISWQTWAEQMTDMTTAYLLAPVSATHR